jgi:STE24 endopeptidase
MAGSVTDFTLADAERARRYNHPRYAVLAADVALGLAIFAALAFAAVGDRLYEQLDGLSWWARALAFSALVVLVSAVLRLPLSFWRGYFHEHRFGLSTQGWTSWLLDRAKAIGVGVVLAALPFAALVGLARTLPVAWPAIAAPGAAALVVLLGLVAPVLLEPLFNRFEPLPDAELAAELRALSERAGVPVRDVLVADASRRTRKENAYVSGLGHTRRIVLYDTLLARAARPEIRLVTAHELAHRRERHVAKGAALGALGAAVFVLVLWGLFELPGVLDAVGATGADDPRVAPFVLLVAAALELLALPFGSALSRRWERLADRFSLELTGDLAAFEATHVALARSNLADLEPPRVAYALLFTHPTPPERLAAARAQAIAGSSGERAGSRRNRRG